MTESFIALLNLCSQTPVKNIVVNFNAVQHLDIEFASTLLLSQNQVYDAGQSMIICELRPSVENFLDEQGILELLNTTPTESEAGDIVLMEEIERELLREGE